jgi:hypothetical protein
MEADSSIQSSLLKVKDFFEWFCETYHLAELCWVSLLFPEVSFVTLKSNGSCMLWMFGKQSALKLGIAKSVESKSQVSLSMTSCLQVHKQLVKCHMKIHLWSLLTLRILFKGWRVWFVTSYACIAYWNFMSCSYICTMSSEV